MGARPIGSHGSYPHKRFTVPVIVAQRAALGLYYRSVSDRAYRDRTTVGAERAQQLSAGDAHITLRDVAVMRAWFARHAQDVAGVAFNTERPSNGWKSILLWGGLEAMPWLDELWRRHAPRENPTQYEHAFAALQRELGPQTDDEDDDVSFARIRLWDRLRKKFAFGYVTDAVIARILPYSPLIEIGAGNGYWAYEIARAGGDIVAFDDHSWGLGSEHFYAPVHQGSEEMLRTPVARGRTLLMVWPHPADGFDARAVRAYRGDVLLLVGEPGTSSSGSSTGSPEMWGELEQHWKRVESVETVAMRPDSAHEYLMIYRRKSPRHRRGKR